MNIIKNIIDQTLPDLAMTCYTVKHLLHMKPSTHISKYIENLNMFAKKRYFTEFFPFEAYQKSEKLELTKKNEYEFRNQHPENYLKNKFSLTDSKHCVGQCNSCQR